MIAITLGISATEETSETQYVVPVPTWNETMESANTYLGILPKKMPGSEHDTTAIIELGKALYFEKALSANSSQSCADCHPLHGFRAGADNLPKSPGALGKPGARNTQSVLNAGFQPSQFWDGRALTLHEQAKGPVLNPVEMAMASPEDAVKRIMALPQYAAMFREAFPQEPVPVTFDSITSAVAAFERTLVSRSRFDRFMEGDAKALTEQERRGLTTFVQYQCTQCHSGPTIGGELFKKVGMIHPYEKSTDEGRYGVTKEEDDLHVFKVPILRNAALTAPYFHDGGADTLAEAIDLMAWMQLDIKLTSEEIRNLMAFIRALADEDRTSGRDNPLHRPGETIAVAATTSGSFTGGMDHTKLPAVPEELYQPLCQSCHGSNGAGYKARSEGANGKWTIPPLWGKEWQAMERTDQQGSNEDRTQTLAAFIRTHLSGGEEAGSSPLTQEQSAMLAEYLMKRRGEGSKKTAP